MKYNYVTSYNSKPTFNERQNQCLVGYESGVRGLVVDIEHEESLFTSTPCKCSVSPFWLTFCFDAFHV